MFKQYTHHEELVWVDADLQGFHRKFCLCYSCEDFKPDEEENCPIAKKVYALCVENNLVTPVWECPFFKEK